jgi:hypothetical protein
MALLTGGFGIFVQNRGWLPSTMAPLVCRGGCVHDIRVGDILDFAPLVQGIFEQLIHVPDFSVAIQGVLQAFQSTALNPHFLGMGQGCIYPQYSQGERKAAPQMGIEFDAS